MSQIHLQRLVVYYRATKKAPQILVLHKELYPFGVEIGDGVKFFLVIIIGCCPFVTQSPMTQRFCPGSLELDKKKRNTKAKFQFFLIHKNVHKKLPMQITLTLQSSYSHINCEMYKTNQIFSFFFLNFFSSLSLFSSFSF